MDRNIIIFRCLLYLFLNKKAYFYSQLGHKKRRAKDRNNNYFFPLFFVRVLKLRSLLHQMELQF